MNVLNNMKYAIEIVHDGVKKRQEYLLVNFLRYIGFWVYNHNKQYVNKEVNPRAFTIFIGTKNEDYKENSIYMEDLSLSDIENGNKENDRDWLYNVIDKMAETNLFFQDEYTVKAVKKVIDVYIDNKLIIAFNTFDQFEAKALARIWNRKMLDAFFTASSELRWFISSKGYVFCEFVEHARCFGYTLCNYMCDKLEIREYYDRKKLFAEINEFCQICGQDFLSAYNVKRKFLILNRIYPLNRFFRTSQFLLKKIEKEEFFELYRNLIEYNMQWARRVLLSEFNTLDFLRIIKTMYKYEPQEFIFLGFESILLKRQNAPMCEYWNLENKKEENFLEDEARLSEKTNKYDKEEIEELEKFADTINKKEIDNFDISDFEFLLKTYEELAKVYLKYSVEKSEEYTSKAKELCEYNEVNDFFKEVYGDCAFNLWKFTKVMHLQMSTAKDAVTKKIEM